MAVGSEPGAATGSGLPPAPPDPADAAGPARRRDRLTGRAAAHKHLLAGSAALVVGAAVQAVTGAVFWLVAARIDTTDDVGRATALFTSVLFVAYLGGLGLPVALARFAPGTDDESHVHFSWSALATVVSTAVIGVVYVTVVDTAAVDALTDWHAVLGPLVFVAACAGSGLSLIIDVRWMTVRRWTVVLVRITIVGLARFPLLALPDGAGETVHLFLVAVIPLALSGFVGVATMKRFTGGGLRLGPRPANASAAIRYSLVNYLSTLAYQGPQFVLPVIVLLHVEESTNAAFYVAWGITAVGLYIPMAIGQALLSEGGKDGAHLLGQVRLVLIVATGLMAAAAAATFVGRDIVTAVYGDDYAEAARVLPGMVAAGIPWAITSVLLTEARVLHRHVDTVVITATLTASILVPALVLVPDEGLDGAAQAFLFGNVLAAVVAVICHVRGLSRTPAIVPEVDTEEIVEVLHP